MGALALRESIASYLARRYGVLSSAQHIMIVSGSQQALFLCAKLLTDKGDVAAIEDPGYVYARWTFEQSGLSLTTMPVDSDGARVDVLRHHRKKPRIIYVTPGHQFPLGPVLTADRRLDLINFATQHGSWILEDDYDSEFRHNGRPVQPLRALHNNNGCVIHIGTFSKTLDPGLRIGYMVLPEKLIRSFAISRILMDYGSATNEQQALALMIKDGSYERHLRRVRQAHRLRCRDLVTSLRDNFGDNISISGTETGSHLVMWLPQIPFDQSNNVVQRAFDEGVFVQSLSPFHIKPPKLAGLILGYGGLDLREIADGVRRLKKTIDTFDV